jgi:hypothetical protein
MINDKLKIGCQIIFCEKKKTHEQIRNSVIVCEICNGTSRLIPSYLANDLKKVLLNTQKETKVFFHGNCKVVEKYRNLSVKANFSMYFTKSFFREVPKIAEKLRKLT